MQIRYTQRGEGKARTIRAGGFDKQAGGCQLAEQSDCTKVSKAIIHVLYATGSLTNDYFVCLGKGNHFRNSDFLPSFKLVP